jgi:predicted RNA-binding protein YlxR (DUF448 family)
MRIVRTPDGSVVVDSSSPRKGARDGVPARSRLPGRGAYLCVDDRCVDRALRSGALRRALRYEDAVPEGVIAELVATGTRPESGGERGRHG